MIVAGLAGAALLTGGVSAAPNCPLPNTSNPNIGPCHLGASGTTATATFTITNVDGNVPITMSLVSYAMCGPTTGQFNDVPCFPQALYDSTTGVFGPGSYSMTVNLPGNSCAYQVDLVDVPVGPTILGASPNAYSGHVQAAIVSPSAAQGGNTVGCSVIRVKKVTNPSGTGQSFTFTGDLAGSIPDGGTIVSAEPFPGTYHTTESVPNGWTLSSINCDPGASGDVGSATATYTLGNSIQSITCTYTDTQQQQPPPQGEITPTNVECSDFLAGAPALGQINYPGSSGKIGQGINPGVFFYWTKITTTTPNQVVTVSQSNTSTNNAALFGVHQGWDRLYTGNCSSWTAGTVIGSNGSGATFTVPTPGNYVIGVKYSTKTIAGTAVPVPANITYNFTTSLGPITSASVPLVKE